VRYVFPRGLIILLVSLHSAFTQTQLPEGRAESLLSPIATISAKVDEVNLAFTVTDKRGHFVGNLQADDFALLDNHSAPERLTFFQQRSDLPLHLAVLIDASDSVKYRFKFEQAAAFAFIKKIMRPGTDRAFVVAFNDQVTTVQELTGKATQVSKALKHVKAGGETALYDAIISASEKLREYPEKQLTRRGIILLSDGVDTVKRSTLEQAEEAAARAQAMIFSVSTDVSEFDRNPEGDAVLKNLAQASGGIFLKGGNEDDIHVAFRDVEKALRSQYVLAYNPADFRADGSYHAVEIVPRKRGLRANCRKGYYAIIKAIHSSADLDLSFTSLVNALH
jgi:Ca-activated chloride channel homolog